MPKSFWRISDADPRSSDPNFEATCFSCANGLFAVRGTHPEHARGLPATTIAGLYTDDQLGFRTVISACDWLGVSLKVGNRHLDPRGDAVTDYERVFNLKDGIVSRRLTWQASKKAQLVVTTEHLCHLADRRIGLQRYSVRCGGGPVRVTLRATVTGDVRTRGEKLTHRHRVEKAGTGVTISAATARDDYRFAVHAIVSFAPRSKLALQHARKAATWDGSVSLQPGETITLEKFVGIATDRDAGDDYIATAQAAAENARRSGYAKMRQRHVSAWARLWREIDQEIIGDDTNALALRYTTAQLLSHAPRADDRVSLAAKPLSGEGYRGHVFWDTDLFMTPAVTALQPALGRHLANYRYEMLPGARENAARWKYRGAWYPWESADDGREVTPTYWLHADGRQMPITCWKYEIHSVCDVAYATWEHYLATGDKAWLLDRGVEILVETARFWASRATYNSRQRRYEIHDVCGPDEAHERTNNCAFINVLAAWGIERALVALQMLKDARPRQYRAFCDRLQLSPEEQRELRRVGQQMYLPQDRRTGWYRQFDGFEDLRFIDPHTAEERYEEPPDAEESQVVKQADVIMLLYLLRHAHTPAQMLANWDYYVPRTTHGTSLSAGTHAAVAARVGLPETALRYFTQSANMDLLNWRGDSGRGLHGAAMGGAICAAVFGFGGVEFHEDHLVVNPILPRKWRGLKLRFVYQGRRLLLEVQPDGFTLKLRDRDARPIFVENAGQRRRLRAGQALAGALLPRIKMRKTADVSASSDAED